MLVFNDNGQRQRIFRTIQPNYLLQPDYSARVIDKVVKSLNLQEIYGDYAEEDNSAYQPQMMIKVIFQICFCGLMNRRKKLGDEEPSGHYLLAWDQVPCFRAINAFGTCHMHVLPKLFSLIVLLCIELDTVDFKPLRSMGGRFRFFFSVKSAMGTLQR